MTGAGTVGEDDLHTLLHSLLVETVSAAWSHQFKVIASQSQVIAKKNYCNM